MPRPKRDVNKCLVIGKVIEVLRTMRGLTQRDLNIAIGSSQSTISRIERGKSQPTLAETRRIAQKLNVSLDIFCRLIDLAEANWIEDLKKVNSSIDDPLAVHLLPWSVIRAMKKPFPNEFGNTVKCRHLHAV